MQIAHCKVRKTTRKIKFSTQHNSRSEKSYSLYINTTPSAYSVEISLDFLSSRRKKTSKQSEPSEGNICNMIITVPNANVQIALPLMSLTSWEIWGFFHHKTVLHVNESKHMCSKHSLSYVVYIMTHFSQLLYFIIFQHCNQLLLKDFCWWTSGETWYKIILPQSQSAIPGVPKKKTRTLDFHYFDIRKYSIFWFHQIEHCLLKRMKPRSFDLVWYSIDFTTISWNTVIYEFC